MTVLKGRKDLSLEAVIRTEICRWDYYVFGVTRHNIRSGTVLRRVFVTVAEEPCFP